MQTQFGDWLIALGVDWSMPSNAGEIRAEKKRRAKDYSVLSSVSGQHWLGFHEPVAGKVYAGALLVAMVKPNAVVFHPIDEGNAWVCAISDGMPVPGRYDQVLPLAEARNTAIEWASLFPKAEMVGDISGAQASLADIFGVLDEGLKAKAIQKKQIAVALLGKNGFSAKRAVGIGLIGIVIAGLAVGGMMYRELQRKQTETQMSLEEAARQASLNAQDKARFESELRAKVTTYQGQIEAARRENEERLSPTALWAAFSVVRQSLPVSSHGYKPQSFECSVQQCRVTWLGAGRFTTAAEKLLLPNVEATLTPDLTANSVFPLTVVKDALPKSQARSADELRFLIQSDFAIHARAVQVEAAQPVTLAPPAGLNVVPEAVAQVGKWHMQVQGGTAVIDAKTIVRMIARWPMRITGIKYQPGSTAFDLDGEFIFLSEKKG